MRQMLPISTFFGLIVAGIAAYAADNFAIRVVLPDGLEWEQKTNQSDGSQYLHEWIQKGQTFETAKWLIVEQKLRVRSGASAREFMGNIFAGAKQACNSVKFNGPESFSADGVDSYVGRFMCGQQKGKQYGTFTDQRVMISGGFAYVVTSELRTPPAAVAGMLSFGGADKKESLEQFLQRQQQSATVVRASVKVCETTSQQCP